MHKSITSILRTFLLGGVVYAPLNSIAAIEFTDATADAGFSHLGETWGASWGDLNNDGRPDLFANNHRSKASLYLNKGDGTFIDVGEAIDLDNTLLRMPNDSHGATWVDFDNDGDQDLMVSDGLGTFWRFYINRKGVLVDQSDQYSISGISLGGGRFPAWFDFNNDGLLDLMALFSRHDARLYEQRAGTFYNTGSTLHGCKKNHYIHLSDLDVDGSVNLVCVKGNEFPDIVYDMQTLPFTEVLGDMPVIFSAQDSAIADFNNDLRPDIFIVRGAKHTSDAKQVGNSKVEALLEVDNGTEKSFSFVSDGLLTVVVSWELINKPDKIWIGSAGQRPADFTFTLDPADPQVWGIKAHLPAYDRGIYIGYDPVTRRWDIYLSSGGNWNNATFLVESTAVVSDVVITGLKAYEKPMKPSLLINTATGFVESRKTTGLNDYISCISIAAGDFDNDMDVDLYLVCKEGVANIANRLYENQGDGSFTLVPGAGGAEGVIGSHSIDAAGTGESVVMADYDSDGFLDLFVTNGMNMLDSKAGGPDQLFHNKGNANQWIELDLDGTASNRDGIGAKVYATAGGITQLREQNGGYHRWSQHHKRLHFGMAGNTLVDLRVEWPSGVVDEFSGVSTNGLYRVTEGGAITPITLGSHKPSPCGPPTFDRTTDQGLYVWKDCPSNTWQVRLLPGGGQVATEGKVASDQVFSNVTAISLEPQWGDLLDSTSVSGVISYAMQASDIYHDGFSFSKAENASVCFGIDAPPGTTVIYGYEQMPVTAPFDLDTLKSCTRPLPKLKINNLEVSESQNKARFNVSLSKASIEPVTVEFLTMDNTAQSGQDYIAGSGLVTFQPGETAQTIDIAIIGDSILELDEKFTVVLHSATNAQILIANADGTILDDDGRKVASLTLMNADTNQPIAAFDPLPDGAVLDLSLLPTRNLSIRANPSDATQMESMRFGWNGNTNYTVDNDEPYSINGAWFDVYRPLPLITGINTVTATPYVLDFAAGEAGPAFKIQFMVME